MRTQSALQRGSDCFFHERSDCFFRQAFSRGAYCCALLFCRIPRPSRREILHRPSSTFSAREYVLRAAPFFSVLIRSFCLLSHGEPLFWHFPFFSSYAVPPLSSTDSLLAAFLSKIVNVFSLCIFCLNGTICLSGQRLLSPKRKELRL